MKVIELRRHAARAKEADALSPEGRIQAEDVGRALRTDYAVVFVSPAQRAAETVAWFLRGSGMPLRAHAIVPGLASEVEDRWRQAARAAGSSRLDAVMATDPGLVADESHRLARTLEGLFDRIPEGGVALAIGHSPFIEAAVYGLTGVVVEPLGETEGVVLTQDDEHKYRIDQT